MTNKQKALEISRKHQIEYLAQISNTNHFQKILSDSECFGSALEMAEWKDQQLKEYLEKKMLYASFVTPLDKKKDIQRKEIETDIYYKIINELFGPSTE